MILPTWAFFGLATATLSAAILLLQERLKINGQALAFWNKTACAAIMLPLALWKGFPDDPMFYILLGCGAVIYAVSDVVFYNGVSKVGAGAVSRLLPASVILSFFLWFAVNPALLDKYLSAPVNSALIVATLCLSAFFATRLKKCKFSMAALRAVWFVLVAATIGPVLAKMITTHAAIEQGPYAWVVAEALMMISIWTVYIAVRRPIPMSVLFDRKAVRGGLLIGCFSSLTITLNVLAFYHADNPAYVPAIRFLDSVIILGFYALMGRKIEGNVRAGLGLVACAAVLIILKSSV